MKQQSRFLKMWNNVELLLNEDTNTVRLYNDVEQESGNALYQVDNLVKISSSEKVVSKPNVYASSTPNCCIIVVDTAVVLFDPGFQTVLIHLYFDSVVDAVTVCPQGQFLLVGERNGSLHIIYIPLKKTVLTKNLPQQKSSCGETTFKSLILHEKPGSKGDYDLFFVIKDGFLHVSNVALGKIQRAIENMDLVVLNKIQEDILMNFFSTKEIHEDGCISASLVCFGSTSHLLIGADGANVLSLWSMGLHQTSMSLTKLLDSSLMSEVKKVQVVDNLMYVLNNEGMLSMLDIHSFVMLCCWPDQYIVDFLLISDGNSSSITQQDDNTLKIMTLVVEGNKDHSRKLVVQSLSSMEVFYSLEVSSESWLIQKGISMDTIYLLEGVLANTKSPEDPVSTVVIRCFTEALPENRLNKLLYKHKFEEAEKFAKTFGLDVELVYKVKLNVVLEKLISASGNDQTIEWPELIQEAKTNLMKIMDEQFVVQYCLSASWPTLSIAEEMLNYTLNRFPCCQIQTALAKLATFSSMYGPNNFDGIKWIEFLNSTDYLKDILALLKEGNVNGAQYLWLRHEGEFASEFDEACFHALLSSISSDIPSQDLIPWFKGVVVPFVWRVLPKGQKIIARWLEHRARNLELTEKSDWPQNGLLLAELGLPSLWRSMGLAEICGAEEVESLRSLVANLRQLCDLYIKYNCHLSLSDYERGSTRSMAFLMLDKVQAPELIPAVVESSVEPYALENGLDLDQTLLDYIKDLLDCCSSQITSLFTEWEAKAVAVLHCMKDTNKVMDAVIEIMYKAVVPWSDTIEKLVQLHLEKEHPKQELLREGYRLMEIKKLLRCYGIRSLALSNSRDIMMLVRYILKQDLPTSLEDSLKLIEAYKLNPAEFHHLHCIQLIQRNKREKCTTLLKSLPHSEAIFVIERMACWARLELQDKQHISEEQKKLQMLISQIMVEALKYLQSIQTDDAFKKTECENNLKMFTAIAHLQEDFDIFLTPEEYDDPVVRHKFNQQLITAYENTQAWRRSGKQHPDKVSDSNLNGSAAVANDPDGKTKSLSTEAGLHRLARQLQKTEQELWADLALRALDAGNVEKALQILSELYQHHSNCSTGRVLFSTAQRLCQMLEENVPMVLPEKTNLPAVIHRLACQAITVCHSDLLLDCLELCKSTRTAADVYRQCQIEDFGFFAKESSMSGEEDAYAESHFHDVFNEDGIVLDPVSVLPLQYKITRNLLPLSESRLFPFDCSCLSYCSTKEDAELVGPLLNPMASMLQMLQECSQLELAVRLLMESYGSILLHFVSNNMDISLSKRLQSNNRMARDKQTLDKIEKTVLSSVSVVVVSLLQKVLNWRVVDSDLAIGLCTILSKAAVIDILWKIINSAWQNYDKIKVVAMVGAHVSFLYKDEEERGKFVSVITDAEWGVQLGRLGVSIQSVFRQCTETKRNLIPTLVKNKNITPDIILHYCSTFGLDSYSAINLYITTLLLQEDRWYEMEIEEGDAESSLRIQESLRGKDDMLESALQIIPQLGSTKDLVISLNTALTKLNPYNYEWIERVLKTIQMADESTTLIPLGQMVGLLQHLKSHRRISPPTDLESSYLLENSLEPTALANTRLPFHLLFQSSHAFWKIVSPELSEETLPTLLLICKLMKVNLDKLYVLAVNHVFKKSLLPLLMDQTKKIQHLGSSKELCSVTDSVFQHALCIQNLELAAATVHKIAQDLPAGAVKTDFLKFSLDLVHKLLKSDTLEESLQARGEALISKLQLQYQRSATENALLSSQLGSPELLKLTGLPGRLIVALFEHSSVLDRMKNPAGQTYPDIHSVASEIASINSVDLLKIRNILLEKWLCQTGQSNGKDINHQDNVTDVNDDPDLMRVVYLLQMHPMDISARLLSPVLTSQTWPLGGSGLRLTFEHRSRALLCLTHLTDAATLETLSNQPSSKIKYYLKCYMYLAQMEALNIPYTLDMFISSPKEGMIKGLWKNHNNEPQAVRLVADLCLEYGVYDLQLWNSVLQKLISFNMTSYLQKVLEALIAVPSLLEGQSLSRIWRSVIQAPFLTASLPLSPQQHMVMYKTFVLLLKCPFLFTLDLVAIAKRFSQFSLQAFSLGTLLLIPCLKKKEPQIQSFLLSCNPTLILDQTEESMATGELAGIPSQIRETVFAFLCQNGKSQTLLKTKHFTYLKRHLISKGRSEAVLELLNCLVEQKGEDEAICFANEYLQYRDLKGEKTAPVSDPFSDPVRDLLEKVLESRGTQTVT
ncbi:kinetochore-associated protein 1 isoform X2 [Danio rerio]|uniref:Kinetochore-associated protein 1 isoform X2 n=1 Tax=Danio rerio TaxID=7955 RepID=A0A8M3ASW0_DANRE|nr:kinetochore-associated protein 1 isoform X2 [Danio rerio]|eukprot:XP_009300259.2 kinetochore-associated protein 1 isoform X2 [Danio rerio]